MYAEFEGEADVVVLARLLWVEARGTGLEGILAVGRAVLNRVPPEGEDRWWGSTLREVMEFPYQFSAFNDETSRLKCLEPLKHDSERAWYDCLEAAHLLHAGYIKDFTLGATHYMTDQKWREDPPKWAAGKTPCLESGGHVFFNHIE